ncbi:3-deoxy-D-manno-octulosonic acid transferase [Telluribacter sp. SYSU D00476]|uniref:3-deoxy-D-manno-octulosonic acid transferase n=1 Tax=Telluribacter sp. SYSU D00476 TaxID=2811430 RepID=UPI001FF3B1FC|nr:glycosyltransferase N-terminal domain-containing protein [Telluribacter sp. SYSU D00476]
MHIVAWFHPKARLWVQGRKGLVQRLADELPGRIGQRPVAWFHAASLGEFEQGRPVIEAFRTRYPQYFILVTFFSPSGYEVRKNYALADYICYLPVDTPQNARRFVEITRPEFAFFIKYEFWYNYLRELRQKQARILSFSAIFRPQQLFFQAYGGFYRSILRYFDHILVQNGESQELLRSIEIREVTLAGDTRFDRVKQIAEAARELPDIAAFVNDSLCMVVGSAWEADMQVLVPFLNSVQVPLKVIIAPHEIHDAEIERWRQQLTRPSLRYSDYASGKVETADVDTTQYLFIDNVGMLSSLYRYGHIAYVGGAFGAGLHNILEAATFGLPVFFGNRKYQKFQEAVDLIRLGGAQPVANTEELRQYVQPLLLDSALRQQKGESCRQYVLTRTGATDKVMSIVEQYMLT